MSRSPWIPPMVSGGLLKGLKEPLVCLYFQVTHYLLHREKMKTYSHNTLFIFPKVIMNILTLYNYLEN